MKKIALLILLIFPFFLSAQQIAKGLTASNGVYIGFYEYKPYDYRGGKDDDDDDDDYEHPLIIFLHGIGERGNGTSELSRVLSQGIPNNIQNGHNMKFYWNGKWESFIVLSPQLSNNYGWWPEFYVEEMIKYAKKHLNIDDDRIYLTGLSLGGGGVWQYAGVNSSNPKNLAAIAPVCGVCSNGSACNITNAKLPVWAFHASDDPIVGAGCTTGMIHNMNNCNPSVKPYMTIWPDGNHYIWGRAYTTDYSWQSPNLYEWFLGQNRKYSVNSRPFAKAGADITISATSGSATLNASSSYDNGGNIVRYAWRKISGPYFGTINNPSSSVTTVSGLSQPGTYQFEVKVIDNRADWSFDTVSVIVTSGVANQPPQVSAGGNATITLPTNSLTLSGSASDNDGYIAGYQWSKISGPSSYLLANPQSASCVVSNLQAGTYVFKLSVADNAGAVAESSVTITVNAAAANKVPSASAGSNQTITLPNSSATLSGSATDDDGYIIGYLWAKVSGPSSFNIHSPNSASTQVSNLVAGTYVFNFKAQDNSGAISESNVTITVNNATVNQPPVVSAGSNQSITLPNNSITLSGSATDADGHITGYLWSKASGPSSHNIHSQSASSTLVSNLSAGTYVFNFKAQDNSGAISESNVTVTVNNAAVNQPPVVSAGSNQSITLPNNSITLSGSATDADGHITGYLWSKASGPSSHNIHSQSASSTLISNLSAGTYVFNFKAQDNSGAIAESNVTITVNNAAVNQPPVVSAGSNQSITLPNNSITLSGSATDADGHITGYLWSKASGPSSHNIHSQSASSTLISNLSAGTYVFNFKAQDNSGAISESNVTVVVNQPQANQPPVVSAGESKVVTLPSNSLTLNGIATDADGYITGYLWSKSSGPSSHNIHTQSQASTVISNLQEGTYVFNFKAQDNSGNISECNVTVAVQSPSYNQPPVVSAGPNKSITLPMNRVILSGSASDADGNIIGYLWSKVSGPESYSIVTPGSASTDVTNLQAGTYVFSLKAADNNHAVSESTVTVSVQSGAAVGNANAGQDVVVTLPINSVSLNGSASYDPAGSIKAYQWAKISGPSQHSISNPSAAVTSVSELVEGIYAFRLVVWNSQWVPTADTVLVQVRNGGPVRNANAGPDVSIQLPVTSISLNASSSYDPAGSIKAYQWSKIAGPAQFNIQSTSSAITAVSGLEQGTYSFRLVVWNSQWVPSDDTVNVTVSGAASAGHLNAGADVTITLPVNQVALNGSAYDPRGPIKGWQWSKFSGPAQHNIHNPNSAATVVSGLVQGTYGFRMVVWDNFWVPYADTLYVVVQSSAGAQSFKNANAGSDISLQLPSNTTTLNGSSSFDPNGPIKAFQWSKISGPSQYNFQSTTSATTTVSGLTVGTYSFRLVVWNNQWVPSDDTVNVVVSGAMYANAGPDVIITLPTNHVTLNASGSSDPNGVIKAYQWTKLDGPSQYRIHNQSAAITEISELIPGSYTFRLVTWNNQWVPYADTVRVIVNGYSSGMARAETIAETATVQKISVYPNPAHDMITLSATNTLTGKAVITLYDLQGKAIRRIELTKQQQLLQHRMNISELAAGVYYVELVMNGRVKSNSKFIKK